MFVVRLFCLFCKQKTAYEMRISDWSSDVCSSDLLAPDLALGIELADALRFLVGDAAWHRPRRHENHRKMAEAQRPDHQPRHDLVANAEEIGRESCRERGCQNG